MPKKSRELSNGYNKTRKQVLKRDKNTCQFPECKCKRGLQIHHVLRYADCIPLREDTYNLITLCRKHHKFITGKESFYKDLFLMIIIENENNSRQ